MTNEEIEKAFNGRWRMKNYILENIDGKAAKEIARDFFEAGILIGEQQEVPTTVTVGEALSNSGKLHYRASKFDQSLFTTENIQKYGQQMLQDFSEYWTEPNPSHTKLRFELQKTWDLDRRLSRWARNNFNRYGNSKPTLDQQRKDKLADILTK